MHSSWIVPKQSEFASDYAFSVRLFMCFKVLDHAGNTAQLLPVQFSRGGLVKSTVFWYITVQRDTCLE